MSFLYSQINNRTGKKLAILAGLSFLIFFFIYAFLENAVKGIDSIPIGVETILILGFSFYYLYERMNDTSTLFIYRTYQFWIILGIVLYLAGSFFIYIFASHLRNYDEIQKYWVITNIFSVLKNIFFAIALIVYNKPAKNRLMSEFELSSLN